MDVTKLLETNVTIDIVKSSPTKRIVILSGGCMKAMPDGKEKPSLLVELDGKQINWIPNKTSLKAISVMFGRETSDWVGKTATLNISNINGKEAVIADPQQQPTAQTETVQG